MRSSQVRLAKGWYASSMTTMPPWAPAASMVRSTAASSQSVAVGLFGYAM